MAVVARRATRKAFAASKRSLQPKTIESRSGRSCVLLLLVAAYLGVASFMLSRLVPRRDTPKPKLQKPVLRVTREPFLPEYDPNAPIDKKFPYRVHASMMHVPKCGGTAFSSVVRRVMCELNQGNATVDCCNPGMCDVWSARSCKCLRGCTGHVPDMKALDKEKYDFHLTLVREPLARSVSGFFYRCHNPNEDCFQVNPAFCPSGRLRHCQKERNFTRWSFEQYIEAPEYQNIYTRMAGANKFPYKSDLEMNASFLQVAKENFRKFDLVGIQEAYGATVLAIHFIAGTRPHPIDFQKVRSQPISINHNHDRAAKDRYMGMIRDSSSSIHRQMKSVHRYDVELFDFAKQLFCQKIADMVVKVGSDFWMPDIAPDAESGYNRVCKSK